MSVYTSTQLTTDHGSREGVKPSLIVLHHAATTSLSGLIQLMMPGGRTVSAHAAIGGNQIVNTVPENRRSFSLSAAIFERRVLSAECVNDTLAPNWTLAADTEESIARWVADVSERHDIWPQRDGNDPKKWTVIGHREVYTIHQAGYATACPGGMRLGWIVERAQQILRAKEEVLVKNYVNTGTYVNGGAAKGTKCMTVFGDGTYKEYERDPASATEPAKIAFEYWGPHQELTNAKYEALKGFLQPRSQVGVAPTPTPGPVPAPPTYVGVLELKPKE